MKQNHTKLKGEIDKSTSIVGDFNTLFSTIDESTRYSVGQDTRHHHQSISLTFMEYYPAATEYTFFPSAQ